MFWELSQDTVEALLLRAAHVGLRTSNPSPAIRSSEIAGRQKFWIRITAPGLGYFLLLSTPAQIVLHYRAVQNAMCIRFRHIFMKDKTSYSV